jgi:hypothetical protein
VVRYDVYHDVHALCVGGGDEGLEVSGGTVVGVDGVDVFGPVTVVAAVGVYAVLVGIDNGRLEMEEEELLSTTGVIQMESKPRPWM